MDNQMIHYCFTLSEEQLKYLRTKKYKIDRMDCFMSLVSLAERETKQVQVSKTQQVEILRGQVMIDNTELAKLWDKDRKTVPKLLEAMEELGISSSQKVGDNRIHTLHSLTGWYLEGKFVPNEFATKRSPDGSSIFHKDVPPAKVITIEVDDPKNKDEQGADSSSDNSPSDPEGKPSSFDGSSSLCSSQSNDSGNVGTSGANGNQSPSSANGTSSQSNSDQSSAGNPSCGQEADAKQNEWKQNPNQPHHSGQGYQTSQNGSGFNGNKPNGYYPHNGYNNGYK